MGHSIITCSPNDLIFHVLYKGKVMVGIYTFKEEVTAIGATKLLTKMLEHLPYPLAMFSGITNSVPLEPVSTLKHCGVDAVLTKVAPDFVMWPGMDYTAQLVNLAICDTAYITINIEAELVNFGITKTLPYRIINGLVDNDIPYEHKPEIVHLPEFRYTNVRFSEIPAFVDTVINYDTKIINTGVEYLALM